MSIQIEFADFDTMVDQATERAIECAEQERQSFALYFVVVPIFGPSIIVCALGNPPSDSRLLGIVRWNDATGIALERAPRESEQSQPMPPHAAPTVDPSLN